MIADVSERLLTSSSLFHLLVLAYPILFDADYATIDSKLHAWSRHWISCSAPRSIIQNPHAKGFSAGGSSSGCAALVCSNQVDLAIGGDQSGSIRIVSRALRTGSEDECRAVSDPGFDFRHDLIAS